MARRWARWALGAFVPLLVAAQNITSPVSAASTFWLEETETQFSVNVADDSSDVFLYLSTPVDSWVGFGFGAKMEDSLMFIVYPNEKNDNITTSPRLGSASSEPTFTPAVTLTLLPGTQLQHSILTLAARCSNCRVWPHGFLNTSSTVQPLIYAFGPQPTLHSDSPSATLNRHSHYATFTMDMLAATGPGHVPAPRRSSKGVVLAAGGMKRDRDAKKMAHAVLGCVALFLLWPVQVLVSALFGRRARVLRGVWVLVLVCLGVAYVLGVVASRREGGRSKAYTTPHQIIAFLSLLPLLLTSFLPLTSLHSTIPSLHPTLSLLSLLSLFLTGALGLHHSHQPRPLFAAYLALALLISALCAALTLHTHRTHTRTPPSTHAHDHDHALTSIPSDPEPLRSKLSHLRRGPSATGAAAGSATLTPVPLAYQGYGATAPDPRRPRTRAQSRAPGQRAQGAVPRADIPGPRYLLNMHPGVPVQVGRM